MKSEVNDTLLAALLVHIREAYGLPFYQIVPLGLGNDANAAVYEARLFDSRRYFLKSRRGTIDPASVAAPRFLHDQGIDQVVAPVPTRTGALWTECDGIPLLLYPYLDGRAAWGSSLSDDQWRDFGRALKRIHTSPVPHTLAALVQREVFSPWARDLTRDLLVRSQQQQTGDGRRAMAGFLRDKAAAIEEIIAAAEQLAERLRMGASIPNVLCHSDLHHGNIMLLEADRIAIVDWDNPVLAPKERDLMFIGGDVGGPDPNPNAIALFYEGYGPAEVDLTALAYYRYERIVQDIVDYGVRALGEAAVDEDTAAALGNLNAQFGPNDVVAAAHDTARRLGGL